MEESSKEPLPWGVSVVALLFGLGAAWQFFSQTWPALTSGDPTLLSKSVNVVLDVFLVWGLVTRQTWAWWLSLVVLSVNVVTSLLDCRVRHGQLRLRGRLPCRAAGPGSGRSAFPGGDRLVVVGRQQAGLP